MYKHKNDRVIGKRKIKGKDCIILKKKGKSPEDELEEKKRYVRESQSFIVSKIRANCTCSKVTFVYITLSILILCTMIFFASTMYFILYYRARGWI